MRCNWSLFLEPSFHDLTLVFLFSISLGVQADRVTSDIRRSRASSSLTPTGPSPKVLGEGLLSPSQPTGAARLLAACWEKVAPGQQYQKRVPIPTFSWRRSSLLLCYHSFSGPCLPTSIHGMLLSFTVVNSRFLLSNVADERSGKSAVFSPESLRSACQRVGASFRLGALLLPPCTTT